MNAKTLAAGLGVDAPADADDDTEVPEGTETGGNDTKELDDAIDAVFDAPDPDSRRTAFIQAVRECVKGGY